MDELLAEHAKRREYDLSSSASTFSPPASSSSHSAYETDAKRNRHLQPPLLKPQKQPEKMIIDFGLDSNSGDHPRLKILDEIPHPPNTKSVTWSETLESPSETTEDYTGAPAFA